MRQRYSKAILALHEALVTQSDLLLKERQQHAEALQSIDQIAAAIHRMNQQQEADEQVIATLQAERAAVVTRLRSILQQVDEVLGPDTLIARSCEQMIVTLASSTPER